MVQADRAMLRLHVEAVWGVKLPPIDANEITLLPESAQPGWQLYAADLAEGRVLIWRADFAFVEREKLLTRLEEGGRLPKSTPLPPDASREVAFCLNAAPVVDLAAARRVARVLTADDYALIEAFWPGEARRILQPDLYPPIGVVVDGSLLSLAHSSRRTAEACELGIDTLPEARRRGYALAATVVWSSAIREQGLTPIYSALAENIASLHLAEAAGYRAFARAISLR